MKLQNVWLSNKSASNMDSLTINTAEQKKKMFCKKVRICQGFIETTHHSKKSLKLSGQGILWNALHENRDLVSKESGAASVGSRGTCVVYQQS